MKISGTKLNVRMTDPRDIVDRRFQKTFGPFESPRAEKQLWRSRCMTDFFLARSAREYWRNTRAILFPNICCVCASPAVIYLSSYRTAWPRFWKTRTVVNNIPHCAAHGREGRVRLIVDVVNEDSTEASYTWCYITGLNDVFLSKTKQLNGQGEVEPVWVAFPNCLAITWSQGFHESWWREFWWPYWTSLSSLEREEVMEKHNAPEEWRQELRERFPKEI